MTYKVRNGFVRKVGALILDESEDARNHYKPDVSVSFQDLILGARENTRVVGKLPDELNIDDLSKLGEQSSQFSLGDMGAES